MIPTFNRPALLTETLQSVLAQDPGPDQMQIQVCDNFSDVADIGALVRELGRGRVEYFRHPRPSHDNHNTCIQRSRGQWVHILHDDDVVMDGYYSAYHNIIEANPDIGMIAGQVVFADAHLRWQSIFGPMPPPGSNRLEDFSRQLALANPVRFPGVVVRRSIYEQVGGFCYLIPTPCDVDLWMRVALAAPVAGTHRPYALYRIHAAADSHGLFPTGRNIDEYYAMIQINHQRLRKAGHKVEPVDYRAHTAVVAQQKAWYFDDKGNLQARLAHAGKALKFKPSLRTLAFWGKSWLKYRLRGNQ
jgi:glycosyltransferase involved in cell wall biosynthesis